MKNQCYQPTQSVWDPTFGSILKGRVLEDFKGFRYKFNNKESDDEVKGEGNSYDYGMRIYDNRLGRFLSIDPLQRDYPWLSTYQFAANTPIQAIDLDGLENVYITTGKQETMKLTFTKTDIAAIVERKTPEKRIFINLKSQTPDPTQFKGANIVNENKIYDILLEKGKKEIPVDAKMYSEYNKTHDGKPHLFEAKDEGPMNVPPLPIEKGTVKMKTIRVAYISVHVDGPKTDEIEESIERAKKANTASIFLGKEEFDKVVYLPTQYNPAGKETQAKMSFYSSGTQQIIDPQQGDKKPAEKKK